METSEEIREEITGGEEEGEIRRKIIRKTTYKIQQESTTTESAEHMAARKLLYGKDLSEYDEMDVDELLTHLTAEELDLLAREVDPDDALLPADQRSSYRCEKNATGPLNRKQLIEHINKQALETPDVPEVKPYIAGMIRGKKWIAPESAQMNESEDISIDLGGEYEEALGSASEDQLVDLAAILGFHSMMSQEQYHASLLNKGQLGVGWGGITKATQPKALPMEPPNDTDPDDTIRRVKADDSTFTALNWNNIKNISDEKFIQLFDAVKSNTHLEVLSISNTGIGDKIGSKLVEALEKNSTLRVVNLETNFITPSVVVKLIKSLLAHKCVEEFRASNQRSQVLGNKIEMEITNLLEQNPCIFRLGLHLEYNDARNRVATHLQRNLDRRRIKVKFNIRVQDTSFKILDS